MSTPPEETPQASVSAPAPMFDRRVVALGVARMADAVGNSFLIIVLPLFIVERSVNGFGFGPEAFTGLVLGVFGVVNSATQPFAGRLSDRTGQRKALVIGGLVLLACANAALAFVEDAGWLLVIRALQGFSAAFTITSSVAMVNEFSTRAQRGRNMGTYNGFRLLGFGVGPIAAGLLIEGGPYPINGVLLTGFDMAFAVATASAVLGAVLVVALVERSPAKTATAVRRQVGGWSFPRSVWILGVATLTLSCCIALLASLEATVNTRLQQGAFMFSIQFTTLIAMLTVFQPVVGRLSDTYGRRPFVLWGLIALIPTTIGQGLVETSAQLILARALQGIAGAAVFSPALALAGDLAEEGRSGVTLSVLTMSFGLGIAFGQFLSGFLGSYAFWLPFAVGGGMATVAAALTALFVQEPAE
ncbi:MAG: MFS transporter [Myxococcota bacterium]